MKRIYTLTLAVLLLAGGSAVAQQAAPTETKTLTLDECIQYALANHTDAQNAQLDLEIAKAQIKDAASAGLPQVALASSLTFNTKLPRFFQAYQPPSDGSISFFGDIPGVAPGSVLAAQNFFQLKNTGDANVTVNQKIFDASYFVGLQAASAVKQNAMKLTAVTQTMVIQNVTKAYYAALIMNDRLTSLDANIARVDSTLRSQKIMQENGLAENIDVQRSQVQFNNLVTDRTKFFNSKKLAIEALKFQMNYPMDEDVNIAGSVQDVQLLSDPTGYADGFTYENRFDYQALEIQRKMQGLQVKYQNSTLLPTLGAYFTTGFQTQSANIAGLFKTDTKLPFDSDQIGPDKWYNYSVVGLRFNWNLFTGLSRYNKIQMEKIRLQKSENSFKRLKSQIDYEVKTTAINYDNALQTLNAQKQNMELASNVYRVARIKFEQGVGSNLEVVSAESDYRTAQNNYYGALYDAMIAKVDLDKAYGRLSAPTTASTTK